VIDTDTETQTAENGETSEDTADVIREDGKVKKSKLKTTISLLDGCPELQAISTYDGEIDKFIRGLSLPSKRKMKDGLHWIPYPLLQRALDGLDRMAGKRKELVAALRGVYLEYCKTAQAESGSLYNPRYWKSESEYIAEFEMDYFPVTMDTPSEIREILGDVAEKREKEAMANRMTSMFEDTREATRELFQGLVDALVGALGEGRKRFSPSLVENLGDFLSVLDARNVTGDDALAALGEKAKRLLAGMDPKDLSASKAKGNESYRVATREALEEIKAELDTMVEVRPSRVIEFDEEES
jgi:hypothetical protein